MSDGDFFVCVIGGIALVAALAIGAWIGLANYKECRATPHTALYCLTSGG